MDQESKRQTGRTTRMIRHAIELAGSAKRVYVVGANTADADRLAELAVSLAPADRFHRGRPRIIVTRDLGAGTGSIEFVSANEDRVNLLGLFVAGAPSGAVYLWDHFAIESALRRQLAEMVRWDTVGPEVRPGLTSGRSA